MSLAPRKLNLTAPKAVLVTTLIMCGLVAAIDESGSAVAEECLVTPGTAPTVPAITATPGTPEEARQYAVAERVASGLDSSDEAIKAAMSDPKSTTTALGTPLTPLETADIQSQDHLAGQAVAVDSAEKGDENYGGSYPDPADPSVLDVVIAHHSCSTLDALRSEFSDVPIQGVAAANDEPRSVLEDEFHTYTENIVKLQTEGVLLGDAGVSISANELLINLMPESPPESISIIQRQIGTAGVVITFQGTPSQAGAGDVRMNPAVGSRVYGGEDINDHYNYCSSNLSLHNDSGDYYVSTAGHCFGAPSYVLEQNGDAPPNWTAGSVDKKIGSVDHDPVSDGAVINCDCAASGTIPASKAASKLYDGNNQLYALDYYAEINSTHLAVGVHFCESGVHSFEDYHHAICGHIYDSAHSATVTDEGRTYTLNDAIELKYDQSSGDYPEEGDSGGPVYTQTTLMGLVTTVGVQYDYASKAQNIDHYYPHLSYDLVAD